MYGGVGSGALKIKLKPQERNIIEYSWKYDKSAGAIGVPLDIGTVFNKEREEHEGSDVLCAHEDGERQMVWDGMLKSNRLLEIHL